MPNRELTENRPKGPRARRAGCLRASGCVLTVLGLLLVVFGAFVMAVSEQSFHERLAQNDSIMERYYQDTARIHVQVRELQEQARNLMSRGDTLAALALEDSIAEVEALPDGIVRGFNIGGAFGLFLVFAGLVPLAVGIVLGVVAFIRKRK